jgi:DDE superfamily endonuclease
MPPRDCPTKRLLSASTHHGKWSANGASASLNDTLLGSRRCRESADHGNFPPDVVVAVKALACELPHESGLPLSRFSYADLKREVIERGIVASIGETTLWRWLHDDAIKPWTHQSWVFPRDPQFAAKAGPILDLYQGRWRGKPLSEADFVLCADEKPSIQARRRKHSTAAPAPNRSMRVEHEYFREGAWTYIAAWDVRRAKVFGTCVPKSGIIHFDALVDSIMTQPPYNTARRVFWIVDNASVHRGQRCVDRFKGKWPNSILIHTPNHASWLNQVEVYFSIVQRKVLTPNDFDSLQALQRCLLDFEDYYEEIARPFAWKFTRQDLNKLLQRLAIYEPQLAKAA